MKCINCKTDFISHPDDLSFYEKMQVPPPRYCPPCRMQRRLLHRNERTLYRRPCDNCKKDAVSIYPPGKFVVYCNPCWWGDSWDGKDFGMEYDPARPFFEQYIELQSKVPRINLLCITSVNSEYTNNAEDNKNCYLLFAAGKNEDCMYGRLVEHCKSVVDCAWTYDSELCYECLDVRQCYGCMFCERCQTSRDLLFCFDVRDSRLMFDASNAKDCAYMADVEDPTDCIDGNNMYYKPERCLDMMGVLQTYNSKFCTYVFYCHDIEYSDSLQNCENCFGCIGLKKASYCILNKQYSRDDYFATISNIKLQMTKAGEYGDFLPPETSPFKYNETLAKDYFPDPNVEEIKTGTYGKENGKDIFACVDCKKNFKITPNEFAFYERMGLPLPQKDFECRMQDRLRKRTPRKLWQRTCMNPDAAVGAPTLPGRRGCLNTFETTYAPDRPETVYCETCYQAKVA